jgi:hypothetical protein
MRCGSELVVCERDPCMPLQLGRWVPGRWSGNGWRCAGGDGVSAGSAREARIARTAYRCGLVHSDIRRSDPALTRVTRQSPCSAAPGRSWLTTFRNS